MRSRDGSFSFTFSICALYTINCLISSVLFADEYLISYRDVVVNSQLYNHQFYISKSMQKCQGREQHQIILENPNHLSLEKLLATQEAKFYRYTQKIGLEIQDDTLQKKMKISSHTLLTFKTKCFDVDVNENFVKIAYIKKEKD